MRSKPSARQRYDVAGPIDRTTGLCDECAPWAKVPADNDNMVWNPLFRQRLVLATLFMGLFSQFQMVFACELMDGKTQYVCCCDEAGNMSKGCAMGGGCQHQMPDSAMASGCCEVSYQQAPVLRRQRRDRRACKFCCSMRRSHRPCRLHSIFWSLPWRVVPYVLPASYLLGLQARIRIC